MKNNTKLNRVLRQHGLRRYIIRTIYIGEYSRQEINRIRIERDKAFLNMLTQ